MRVAPKAPSSRRVRSTPLSLARRIRSRSRVAATCERYAAMGRASSASSCGMRGSDGMLVELRVEKRDPLSRRDLARAPQLVVADALLVTEEETEPEPFPGVRELTRGVEIRRIVRDAILVDLVELGYDDAVVVNEQLDEAGILDGALVDRRRVHRTTLQDAHEREAVVVVGSAQRRVEMRRQPFGRLGNEADVGDA